MSSLFNSLKEKAQAAANAHGFGHSDGDGESGKGGPMGGIVSSHTIESLSHQLRSMQQQYSSSTTPVQKIITTGKGIAIDFDSVSRDAQAHSKEFYIWGQTESDDLKDVTDRLAWLSFVQGSLAGTLAGKIDKSRATFKDLRASEGSLAPRRNIRVGMENQIARMEHEQRKELQGRLQELKTQLRKNEEEDSVAERDIEVLKRKAVKVSEQEKWEAIREYAEKLSMVAQAALAIVPALPDSPPAKGSYNGSDITASVRASLQKALDGYSPGNITLILAAPTGADLKHTRSFGETHAHELSNIDLSAASVTSNIPITPPPPGATAPPPQTTAASQSPSFPHPQLSPSQLSKPTPLPVSTSAQSVPSNPFSPPSPSIALNPANLNQSPAPIPHVAHQASSLVSPDPSDPSTKVPSVTPTVAETGVPKVAGPEGPGPSSGSLLDKHANSPPMPNPFESSPAGAQPSPPKWESAEEEKKRLEREEREKLLSSGTSGGVPKYESAEEEKKRLEREERERVLRQGGSGGPGQNQGPQPPTEHDGELPPYQEF